MRCKGNCWDNAVMERFFLKRVWQRDYANHAEAVRGVTDYIVGLNNNVRLHSKQGISAPYGLRAAKDRRTTYRGDLNHYISTANCSRNG